MNTLQQNQIDKLIEEIASGYQPEKIYLFGSVISIGKEAVTTGKLVYERI